MLKIQFTKKYKHNRDAYTDAKSDFILKYAEKAKEGYGDKYASENQ